MIMHGTHKCIFKGHGGVECCLFFFYSSSTCRNICIDLEPIRVVLNDKGSKCASFVHALSHAYTKVVVNGKGGRCACEPSYY